MTIIASHFNFFLLNVIIKQNNYLSLIYYTKINMLIIFFHEYCYPWNLVESKKWTKKKKREIKLSQQLLAFSSYVVVVVSSWLKSEGDCCDGAKGKQIGLWLREWGVRREDLKALIFFF